MSIKKEQYYSLLITREFLRSLLHPHTRPKNITEMKQGALRCLRHYPFLDEDGKPRFSNDNSIP